LQETGCMHMVIREEIAMRIAVGGLTIGCLLVVLLMIIVPVLIAGILVAAAGIIVQIYWLKNDLDHESEESIGFWVIIGAAIPVYCWVLKGFAGVLY